MYMVTIKFIKGRRGKWEIIGHSKKFCYIIKNNINGYNSIITIISI